MPDHDEGHQPNPFEMRGLRLGLGKDGLLVVVPAIIVLVVLLGVTGLERYIRPSSTEERNDFVQTLGQAVAALFLFSGAFFAWRNLRVSQRTLEHQQVSLRSMQEQQRDELHLAQQGQITERFTRATDQLGSAQLETRLGGIYALERITRDSPEDYWPVIEILTAYVRRQAPWQREGYVPREADYWSHREWLREKRARRRPPLDIDAILSVLNRRKRFFTRGSDRGEPEPINLYGTDLAGALIPGIHWEGIDLRRANLMEADLREAHLDGAMLDDVHLEIADLQGAHLDGARIVSATLCGCNLAGAFLTGADLRSTRLEGANLAGADLTDADLSHCTLHGTDLGGAIGLRREKLAGATGDERTTLPEYVDVTFSNQNA